MFSAGHSGTCFAELATVQGSAPSCARCGKSLSKKLAAEHFFDRSKAIVSFWSIRCPDCHQAHIIFNSTNFLPKPAAVDSPFSNQKPEPPDDTQPRLFA